MAAGDFVISGLVIIFGLLILKRINMTNEEAVAKINANTERLTKIQGEIQKLKDAINNSGNVSPEIEAALASLDDAVGATDDMNEDEVTE